MTKSNGAPVPPKADALARRLAHAANTATPREVAEFTPSPTHRALAGALFSNPTSLDDLASRAGLDRSTVTRVLKDPAAANWITAQGTDYAQACLGAVHARLLHLALTARSTTALKLYMERFDPHYKPPAVRAQETKDAAVVQQFGQFLQMSGPELQAWLRHKERSLSLDVPARTDPEPEPAPEGPV